MRNLLVAASVAALAMPCAALAQPNCWSQHEGNAAAGTVTGAGTGALVGAAVAGPVGAVAGAIGGAAVGSTAGASAPTSCGYTRVGYYDSDGVWHAGPGYAGPAYQTGGYYDADGNWVPYAAPPPLPVAGAYGADVAYSGDALMARENRLDRQIDDGESSGSLSGWQARDDHGRLDRIRNFQADRMAEDGGLTPGARADIARRLDDLDATIHAQWGD